MTFDDGILKVYKTVNKAEPGNKPVIGLEYKDSYYFGYAELGFQRVYNAMQAKQQVDAIVNVPDWNDIRTLDICAMEDGGQYQIGLVQPTHDEDGLRIMKLTLQRLEEHYEL